MIFLHTLSETGTVCPKCGNSSVFKERIYKFLGLIYSHTIHKCEMGTMHCTYTATKVEK